MMTGVAGERDGVCCPVMGVDSFGRGVRHWGEKGGTKGEKPFWGRHNSNLGKGSAMARLCMLSSGGMLPACCFWSAAASASIDCTSRWTSNRAWKRNGEWFVLTPQSALLFGMFKRVKQRAKRTGRVSSLWWSIASPRFLSPHRAPVSPPRFEEPPWPSDVVTWLRVIQATCRIFQERPRPRHPRGTCHRSDPC